MLILGIRSILLAEMEKYYHLLPCFTPEFSFWKMLLHEQNNWYDRKFSQLKLQSRQLNSIILFFTQLHFILFEQ